LTVVSAKAERERVAAIFKKAGARSRVAANVRLRQHKATLKACLKEMPPHIRRFVQQRSVAVIPTITQLELLELLIEAMKDRNEDRALRRFASAFTKTLSMEALVLATRGCTRKILDPGLLRSRVLEHLRVGKKCRGWRESR